jgi:CDP-4-dehydro-6-deoxyglucose reductase
MAAQPYQGRFVAIRKISPTTKHFAVELLGETGRFEYLPGQFASFTLPIPVRDPIRPYSIASPPEGTNRFDLCLNWIQDGPGSAFLFGLEPGAVLPFTGPWGSFVLRGPSEAPKAFIATGTGIAPIRAQLHWLFRQGFKGEAWLLFGARNEQEILYHEEWMKLAREHPNFRYIPTLSKPGSLWQGPQGYVQVQLEDYLKGRKDVEYYLCGRRLMVEHVRSILAGWGVERRGMRFERFD